VEARSYDDVPLPEKHGDLLGADPFLNDDGIVGNPRRPSAALSSLIAPTDPALIINHPA
jgi:hypothetical protein